MTNTYLPLREQCCDNCRYHLGGACHRHPPSPLLARELLGWPEVDMADWCGEWAGYEEHQ